MTCLFKLLLSFFSIFVQRHYDLNWNMSKNVRRFLPCGRWVLVLTGITVCIHHWDAGWGNYGNNSSLRNYKVVIFVKFIGLAFNQPPHVWSACGIEVVACTRTTHSRDTVGGGSGVLLVQGL